MDVTEAKARKQQMKLLGLSRRSYYRQVRGMKGYQIRGRQAASAKHNDVSREVAIKRVEVGDRRVRV